MSAYLNVSGIVLSLVGGWILASILLISADKALEYGVPRYAAHEREENLSLPMVRLFLAQSRRTLVGMSVVSFGSLLQIIANWPTR